MPRFEMVPEPWMVLLLVSAGPAPSPVMAPPVRVIAPAPLSVVALLISSVPFTAIAPELVSVAAVDRVREAPVSTVTVPELASDPTVALSDVSLLAPMVTVAPVLLVHLPATPLVLAGAGRLALLVVMGRLWVRLPEIVGVPFCSRRLGDDLVNGPAFISRAAPSKVV